MAATGVIRKVSTYVVDCDEHKNHPRSKKLFNDYKIKFITKSKAEYKNFSKNYTLSFYAGVM